MQATKKEEEKSAKKPAKMKKLINSGIKLKCYPTRDQRAKLSQMFDAHCGIYSMLAARLKKDCAAHASKKTRVTVNALDEKYRTIATEATMR